MSLQVLWKGRPAFTVASEGLQALQQQECPKLQGRPTDQEQGRTMGQEQGHQRLPRPLLQALVRPLLQEWVVHQGRLSPFGQ